MARKTSPRTIVRKADLPRLYSSDEVLLIANNFNVAEARLPALRRKLISVMSAYLDMLANENASIKASRRKARRRDYRRMKRYPALHTDEDTIKIPKPGRRQETSLCVLITWLAVIFHDFTGEWPKRSFDRVSRENIGRFEDFIYEATRQIFPDQRTFDHLIKWYVHQLKIARPT